MNSIKCEYCGKVIEHEHVSAICVYCGHIMKMIPFQNDEFEKVDDIDFIDKKIKKNNGG